MGNHPPDKCLLLVADVYGPSQLGVSQTPKDNYNASFWLPKKNTNLKGVHNVKKHTGSSSRMSQTLKISMKICSPLAHFPSFFFDDASCPPKVPGLDRQSTRPEVDFSTRSGRFKTSRANFSATGFPRLIKTYRCHATTIATLGGFQIETRRCVWGAIKFSQMLAELSGFGFFNH